MQPVDILRFGWRYSPVSGRSSGAMARRRETPVALVSLESPWIEVCQCAIPRRVAGQMGVARMRSEIPDWILDDTASVASQIGLKRNEVEDFLGRKLRKRRLLFW